MKKFAVCNVGGGFAYVGAMQDSFPHALELSKKGYNAFVLIYRPGAQTVCEDLARAVRFIRKNADVYRIDPDAIAVMGFSAGGIQAGELMLISVHLHIFWLIYLALYLYYFCKIQTYNF